jgi:hypothetical protein
MTNTLRPLVLIGTMNMLFACGERTMAEESNVPPRPPDVGAEGGSDAESEGEIVRWRVCRSLVEQRALRCLWP